MSVTYTAMESAATARRHYLAEVAANGDLTLVDLRGIGDRAWLYKRLEGPSHTNNQQLMTILKANQIIQITTDDNPTKLPPKFDARMIALATAIAATAAWPNHRSTASRGQKPRVRDRPSPRTDTRALDEAEPDTTRAVPVSAKTFARR